MQLKFIILLVVFVVVSAEEEACGEEKAGVCMLKLLSDVMEETTNEQDCLSLAEASRCLVGATEDCTGEARNDELEDGKFLIKVLTAMYCPLKDVSDDVEKCVEGLESELMECVDAGVNEALDQLMQQAKTQTEVDEDDLKCDMFQAIFKCMVMKVEDKCGEEASVAALAEILDDDEIKESCKLPDVSETNLRSVFYDLEKKRRK